MLHPLPISLALLTPALAAPAPDAERDEDAGLKGVAVDEGGLPLPGVSVTLSSPALPDGPMRQTTDANGRFNFQGLPPGRYDLVIERPDFETVQRAELQAWLGRDTIVIAEMPARRSDQRAGFDDRRPPAGAESAQEGQVLTQEFLESIPTGRDYLSALSSASPARRGPGSRLYAPPPLPGVSSIGRAQLDRTCAFCDPPAEVLRGQGWTAEQLAQFPAGRDLSEVVRLTPGLVEAGAATAGGDGPSAGEGWIVIVDGVRVGGLPPTDHDPVGLRLR